MTFGSELKSTFDQQGYLILPDFISPDTCRQLIAEQQVIINDPSLLDDSKVIFDTGNQRHTEEQYFFDSARKIKLFYEKDAFDQNGNLNKTIDKAINKIGHALHDLNLVFENFSYQQEFRDLALLLGMNKPQIVQSMYLLKQPKIGNQVDLHQDSTFIYTEPETCIGFWFALEDANRDNGCLWAIPGGHLSPLRERLIRHNNSTHMEILDTSPFDLSKAIPLEVKAGTLIVLHGRVPHYSEYNHSSRSRHAYSLHIVDADAEYSQSNWLQTGTCQAFRTWQI